VGLAEPPFACIRDWYNYNFEHDADHRCSDPLGHGHDHDSAHDDNHNHSNTDRYDDDDDHDSKNHGHGHDDIDNSSHDCLFDGHPRDERIEHINDPHDDYD
jgi:hypothetical protein